MLFTEVYGFTEVLLSLMIIVLSLLDTPHLV